MSPSRQTQALPNTEAPLLVLWDQVMCFGAPHGLRGSCAGASEELGISTTLAELPNKEGLWHCYLVRCKDWFEPCYMWSPPQLYCAPCTDYPANWLNCFSQSALFSPLSASSPILLIYNACLPFLSRRCEITNELRIKLIPKAAIIRDHYLWFVSRITAYESVCALGHRWGWCPGTWYLIPPQYFTWDCAAS